MPPQASAGEILLYSGHTLKRRLKLRLHSVSGVRPGFALYPLDLQVNWFIRRRNL